MTSHNQPAESSVIKASSTAVEPPAESPETVPAVRVVYTAAAKDPVGDALLLAMSITVITLSFVMNVQGSTQVCFPGTDVPLPDMCSFRRWTGLDCPGCGMTRAFISIAHGQFALAWQYNPVSFYFFVLVASQIPFRSLQLWKLWNGQEPLFRSGWSYAPAILFMILLLGQWVIRIILPALNLA